MEAGRLTRPGGPALAMGGGVEPIDSMQRLCSTRYSLEAHDVRLFLGSHGIRAMVVGDRNALETGFAFTPASEPAVFVDESDFERAETLLGEFHNGDEAEADAGSWTCAACGESVPATFATCWNCQSSRADAVVTAPAAEPEEQADPYDSDEPREKDESADDSTAAVAAPDEPVDPPVREPDRPAWSLWIELFIVVILLQGYFGWPELVRMLAPSIVGHTTLATEIITSSIHQLIVLAVVMAIIYRGGEPWSKFGLCRPRPLVDLACGLALLIVTGAVCSVGIDALQNLLSDYLHPSDVYRLLKRDFELFPVERGRDVAFVALASVLIGVFEELVMRGYLIVRLERLLHATWLAVLVAAVCFAVLHWRLGILGVWNALLVGVLFGMVFVYFRRIWPLVVAHALFDFIVLVRDGV